MAKTKKKLNNANIRIFLLILVLTACVSLLVKLNKLYTFDVKVPISLINLPEDKILKSYTAKKIEVNGRATGYEYLKYRLSDQEYVVDLSQLKRANGKYFYVFNASNANLGGSLSDSELSRIMPDTIFFSLDENYEKRVPVVQNSDISFAAGYGSLEGVVFTPDTVMVRGPKSVLDSLGQVSTKEIRFKDLKSTVEDSIALVTNEKQVDIIPQRVQMHLEVDKFTEGDLEVPLQMVNVPQDVTAKIFPKRVHLIFNVNLKDYERVKANEFKVVCDFAEIDSTTTTLTPKILEHPDFVRDVRLREKTIQYLLVK
ncbi:MAG: hypothetical protein CL868_03245 [Cytophagaceae bacterium]|nr:hypothetical protein [Cytophagaceae bacterium]|tara:strand:+ start:148 stop:1086 length:939 start_codon:yes stop_codon:yes gene_type:complete